MKVIALDAYPNQKTSVSLDGIRWTIALNTRLGKLYASIFKENAAIVHNRVCLNHIPITRNFVFIDIEGNESPHYTGLNSRFFLVYRNETQTNQSNYQS